MTVIEKFLDVEYGGIIMKCKKVITAFISAIWLGVSSTVYVSNAAVIEPEIVKSETWTTSYYIDDDESTTYPYIDCQADIYSDGTVKCYFWNTHEWDGFATVSHTITILSSMPYSTDSIEYSFYKGNTARDIIDGNIIIPLASKAEWNAQNLTHDFSFWQNRDISYYPSEYKISNNKYVFSNITQTVFYSKHALYAECSENYLQAYSFKGALPLLPTNQKSNIVFTPKVDPIDTYTIRFLGHDITVSPDILSSHIVATPQLSEQEKYIAELEKKNAELTAEIERLKLNPSSMQDDIMRLDANGDGFVNAVDASIVLSIYAYNSTNKIPITKLSDCFKIENSK